MPVASVPDILSFSQMSRNVSLLKQRADVTRTEAVTGVYEDITSNVKGDIGGVHLIKKAIDDVSASRDRLSLANSRAEVTQQVLSTMNSDSIRISMETLSAIGRGDTAGLAVNVQDARTTMSSIFAALGTNFGGRALFGGDVTNSNPMVDPAVLLADLEAIATAAIDANDFETQVDFYFNDPTGGYATNIYQGGAGRAPSVEIAPGIRIDASAKADDQPIKDIIRGLATIAVSTAATFADKNTMIENGATLALGAEKDMTHLRSAIGVSESRIDQANSRLDAEEIVLLSVYNDKTARDPYEATAELQLLESQLEASYLITARLTRLSIANFLR